MYSHSKNKEKSQVLLIWSLHTALVSQEWHTSTRWYNIVAMDTVVVSIEGALVNCTASLLVIPPGSLNISESAMVTMVSTKSLSLVEQKRLQWARERGE
jgi:hypothetical protein